MSNGPCDNLDLRTVEFQDLPALILQCGPDLIQPWIDLFNGGNTPDAGDVTAAQIEELRRVERDLRAERAKNERQKFLIPAAIFATIYLVSR